MASGSCRWQRLEAASAGRWRVPCGPCQSAGERAVLASGPRRPCGTRSLSIPGHLPSSAPDLFGEQVTCRLSVVPRRIRAGHLLSTWPRLLHWAGHLSLNERHVSPSARHLHCWIGSHHSRAGDLPVRVTARAHRASDLRVRRSRPDGENRTCLDLFRKRAPAPPEREVPAARGSGRSRLRLRALTRGFRPSRARHGE